MKSNEEFIAGIYEKAAVYTEEKETNIIKVNWVARATRIAAMVAVCIGLAGIGSLVLGNGNKVPNEVPSEVPQPGNETYGILLSSLDEENSGEAAINPALVREGAVVTTVTFTGVVEHIDEEDNRIWMRLIFDENTQEPATGSLVCIKWDMLEKISEFIRSGVTITATGVLSQYENADSPQNGCAELTLTNTDNLEIK